MACPNDSDHTNHPEFACELAPDGAQEGAIYYRKLPSPSTLSATTRKSERSFLIAIGPFS